MNVSPFGSPTKVTFRSFLYDDEAETFMGIKLKPSYTALNFLAIPFIFFTMAIVGSFTNTQMIFILRDEEYFAVSKENIGSISNDVMFYMILVTTFLSLVFGYIFDIIGRRKTIFFSLLSAAIFMTMVPFMAPCIYPSLILVRIGIGMALIAP